MENDPKNKKYLFDLHNFDIDAEAEKKKDKTPPEPTFSIKDMEQARMESYEKGKAEGIQTAKESIEQRTEVVVQTLAAQLQQLEAKESERKADYEQSSLILIFNALQKIFPSLFEITKENEIKTYLEHFFQEAQSKIGYEITVHPDLQAPLEKYTQTLHPNTILSTNPQMSPNAVTIDWEKGCAHYNPEDMAQKLLDIIMDKVKDKSELLDDSTKKTHNEDATDAQELSSPDTQTEDNA